MLTRVILDIEPYDDYVAPREARNWNSVLTENGERIALYYDVEE
jgi:hypothetical protein